LRFRAWLDTRTLPFPCDPGAPTETAAVIQAESDVSKIQRWLDQALEAASLDDFCRGAGL
jgi:hypothetical protein